jgi:hypothetical protein
MFAGKSGRIFQNAGGKVNAGKVIKCGSLPQDAGGLATMQVCIINYYELLTKRRLIQELHYYCN